MNFKLILKDTYHKNIHIVSQCFNRNFFQIFADQYLGYIHLTKIMLGNYFKYNLNNRLGFIE